MIDSLQLQTLAAVLREGSFERAAQALHVTPSAVSQRIRALEERVGTALVLRGQPCSATEAGGRLCRHAETVALLEDQLRRELPGLPSDDAQARPVLRVAVNADSLGTWFIEALRAFAEPGDALLDIASADQDQTAEWLRRGQVLGAVTAQATAVPGCKVRRLGALRYRATASPAFMARWFAQGVTAEALQRAPSLVFDRDDQLQARWVRRQLRRTLVLPAHRLPSTQGFVEAALAGVGWGLNPEPLVQAALRSGQLVELLPGQALDVPLHWQVADLELPLLQRLTQAVQRAARALEARAPGPAGLSAAG